MAEDERVEETKGGEVPESKDAQRGKTESARVEGRADTLARQDLYLAHLVSGKSVSEASEAAGIDRTTGWRWRKEPEFQKRFIEARRDLFESTVAALHSSAADCIRVLRQITCDEKSKGCDRVLAGRHLLDLLLRSVAEHEFDLRLRRLEEQVAEAKK